MLVVIIGNMFDPFCLMYKIGLDILRGVQSVFFQSQFSSDQNDGLPQCSLALTHLWFILSHAQLLKVLRYYSQTIESLSLRNTSTLKK